MNLVSTFSFAKQVAKILQWLEINFYWYFVSAVVLIYLCILMWLHACTKHSHETYLQCPLPYHTRCRSERGRLPPALQIIDSNWAATQRGVRLLLRCVRTKPNVSQRHSRTMVCVERAQGIVSATLNWLDCCDSRVTHVFVISSILRRSLESHFICRALRATAALHSVVKDQGKVADPNSQD